MKIKSVKSRNELKSGLYIRAVINYHGEFWAEIIQIKGKPFIAKEQSMGRKTWKVRTVGYLKEYFCSDLSQNIRGNASKFGTALIPFSNKVYNYLNNICDLRPFAEAINNVVISDAELVDAKIDFDLQKYQDDELSRIMQEHYAKQYAISFNYSAENIELFDAGRDCAVAVTTKVVGDKVIATYHSIRDFEYDQRRLTGFNFTCVGFVE